MTAHDIAKLEARVEALEEVLAQNGIRRPPSNPWADVVKAAGGRAITLPPSRGTAEPRDLQ
jgi:hypothetical protein